MTLFHELIKRKVSFVYLRVLLFIYKEQEVMLNGMADSLLDLV